MQYLKALVIGMGILIILGVGLLAYGLLMKTKSPATQTESSSSDEAGMSKGFGELALVGNAGCRIERATPDGRRLAIELAPASDKTPALSCEKVVIIDMSAGTIIGGIALQP